MLLLYFTQVPSFSVAPLPIDEVKHPITLLAPLEIRHQNIKSPLTILGTQPTDVRRDDDVLCIPQRVVFGEGFRVRDVEGGATQLAVVEGGDEGGLIEDLAAGDIDDEGSGSWAVGVGVGVAGEDVEFGGAEQVRCCGGQGEGHY